MGQDYSKEYQSTWDDSDVKKWKEMGRAALKNFFLGFEGVQWHEYAHDDLSLLTIKICYALYGPPQTAKDLNVDLENAYNSSQKEAANKIRDKIVEVYKTSSVKKLRIGIIFISCKQEANEFLLPLFRVHVGNNSNNAELSKYVDTNGRIYQNWTDWKENNKLPMLKYCFPSGGYYTCTSGKYDYDPNRDLDVTFGTSPACDVSSRVARQADLASGVTSLASGGIAIAAMFTPLAPVVLAGAAIAGTSAAVYGAGRSIHRLVDKGGHGESLTDLESLTCWLSIVITPVSFATAAANGALAAGARNSGRIFTSTIRTAATILNFTNFGLSSVMFVFGLANLIEKAQNDQLTALDVLQFSMSVFFFGHTLIQPKTASGIIKAAQNEHINAYKNSMTDPEAQRAFQNFVDQNRQSNNMHDNSKIVRTINKINDPNNFFKNVKDMKVDIGGRKGRTVFLEDANGQRNRVNPNRIFFDSSNRIIDFNAVRAQVSICFNQNIDEITLNGEHIFRELTDHQKQRVKTVLGDTARNYNKDIVGTAKIVAETMGYRNIDDFLCVVELVAKETQGTRGDNMMIVLNNLRGIGQLEFIQGIQRDLNTAMNIARRANLAFANELKAVYHYRKHGTDFPTQLQNRMEFYLNVVPDKLFKDANLTNINRQPNGVTMKSYITSKGEFGVLVEFPGGRRCIATMMKNIRQLTAFQDKLAAVPPNNFDPSMFGPMIKSMATSMGLASVVINVFPGDCQRPVSLESFARNPSDPEAVQQMAHILNALLSDMEHK